MTTIAQSITDCEQQLRNSSTSAHIDARALLCHVLDCTSSHLMAWPEKKLTHEQQQQLNTLLYKRAQGMPVAYLTGSREFWSLDLKVTSDTLIPRPETECLVEYVLDTYKDRTELELADLGTGSGAIAIALASERPDWRIVASDISQPSIFVARENARHHGITNIRLVHSNWFERIVGMKFDVIISNPPYVAEHDPHLSRGDVRMEPALALQSGEDGLDAIRKLTQQAGQYLKTSGCLLLEHGYDQQAEVRACFEQAGFEAIIQKNDYAGQPRMTAGYSLQVQTTAI